MHNHALDPWQHSHNFVTDYHLGEKNTTRVMVLTAVMMLIEIITGMWFGSMALLADGWHMATHVAAFSIALFTYRYVRGNANNPRYTFGIGKAGVLGGFASAVALAVVALLMAMESIVRMLDPQAIHFNEAIGVAVIGLIVNLVSGWMLDDHHDTDHEHEHQDHNMRAAYMHVLADALTSIFAIIALIAGKYFGWIWLDPIMGVVGAIVISRWSYGLVRDTSHILLDGGVDEQTRALIQQTIEQDADNRITDLHVWHISTDHYSASVSLITHHPQPPEYYKQLLKDIPHLVHVVIEVNQCQQT